MEVNRMEAILNFISTYIVLFVLIMTVLFFIFTVLFFVIIYRLRKGLQKYKELLHGTDGKNIEKILIDKGKLLEQVMFELQIIRDQVKNAEESSKNSLQKLGLVRYNAFEDAGGEMSFALALLDHSADGMVLTGIFSQEESRTYCKAVYKGKSKHPLSREEKKAIAQALNHKYEE